MKKYILFLILSISFCISYSKDNVKILTWWGYLDKPWIEKAVESKCGVHLAYQNYMDNDNFNTLLPEYKWDIIIFESTILNSIKSSINRKNIDVQEILKKYPEFISNQYVKETGGYIKNITYFFIAYTVFLYNPKIINIDKNDTIPSIIEKLKKEGSNKNFVLLDDANSIDAILHTENKVGINTKEFKEVFDYSNLLVQNNYDNFESLGAMITWSGEAIHYFEKAQKQGIKLNLAVIPKYAFTSSDFIAQLNDDKDKKVQCVYNLLTSKDFLTKLQNQTYYFSPYVNYKDTNNSLLKKEYENFYQLGVDNKLNWLFLSKEKENKVYAAWNKILAIFGL